MFGKILLFLLILPFVVAWSPLTDNILNIHFNNQVIDSSSNAINISPPSLCYQETATSSNSCGGTSGGAYGNSSGVNETQLAWDGDYLTYSFHGKIPPWKVDKFYYFNYSQPTYNYINAIWQVKYQYNWTHNETFNMSIPSNCYESPLKLFIESSVEECNGVCTGTAYFANIRFKCLGGSSNYTLNSTQYRTNDNRLPYIFEEAVYWNFSSVFNYTQDKNNVASSAIKFNGVNEYINTSLKLPQNGTVSFWIDMSFTENNAFLLYQQGNQRVGFGINHTSDYDIFSNSTNPIGGFDNLIPWQYLALVYNTTHMKIITSDSSGLYYGFGTVVINGTSNSSIGLSIGALVNSSQISNFYNGSLDELRIYNRTLADWEIRNLYNMYDVEYNVSGNFATAINQSNGTFNYSIIFKGAEGVAYCGITSSNTNITCSNQTVTNNESHPNCTISGNQNAIIATLQSFCVDTGNNNASILNGQNITFYIDTVLPIIQHSFQNNSNYFNQNITAQFNFSDAGSLYRWNVSIDNINIDGAVNTAYDSYSYNFSYNPALLPAGTHYLVAQVADGHTAGELKSEYKVKYPLLARNEVKFEFKENNYISIVPKGKKLFDYFSTYKEKDKYRFTFNPSEEKEEYSFTITSKEQLNIVQKPKTEYKEWLVSGDHWVDFYIPSENANVKFKRIDNYNVEVIISNLKNKDSLEFNSVGDLNIVTYNFTFQTITATGTYENPVLENRENEHTLYINTTNTNYTYNLVNATLIYNGTTYTPAKTSGVDYISFTKTVTAPLINNDTAQLNFTWNITTENIPNYLYNLSQTIVSVQISNCSNASWIESLRIHGRDEVSLGNVSDMLLNVNFNIHLSSWVYGSTNIENFTFQFDNRTYYSICIYPNSTNYHVDAIMEYGDGNYNYTDRKYFLQNYTLNNVSQDIYLYHLNNSVASDVILTVIDQKDGSRMPDAFIKILRYYPGTNTYNTVEIEKTDLNGETLAKLILADVFYKFIVERPPGNILLNSEVEKIKTIDKTLAVSTATNPLSTLYTILGVNADVSCTESTLTCRFTWSNPKNTAITGRLTVYQDTGYNKVEVYREEITSAAASIVYIFNNITNRVYYVEGAIINE